MAACCTGLVDNEEAVGEAVDMANDNLSTLTEIREMVRIADAVEEAQSNAANVSVGTVTFTDSNGEQIAELRFIDNLGGFTLVFDGQESTDE